MTTLERLALGALGLAAAALTLAVFLFDPARTHWFPDCPLYHWTGLLCPGCGALRAAHRLLHLDLAGAFSMNPLLVLALPWLGYGAWATWSHQRRGRPLPGLLESASAGWCITVLLVAYSVLRNLPWYPFSLLAPH